MRLRHLIGSAGLNSRAGPKLRMEVRLGRDVLVHPEQVVRVVAPLHLHEPVVVLPVGGLHALAALVVHEEVDVRAPGRVRVQRLPVALGPVRDRGRVGGVGVDPHDHLRPARVAIGERGLVLTDPVHRPVDRIQVHRGVHAG